MNVIKMSNEFLENTHDGQSVAINDGSNLTNGKVDKSRGVVTLEGKATVRTIRLKRERWYLQHSGPNRKARRAMAAWARSIKHVTSACNDPRLRPAGTEFCFSTNNKYTLSA